MQLGLNKIQASVNNGTAFRSSADLISAEILSVQQKAIELHSTRKAYMDMLSQFIDKTIAETDVLEKPQALNTNYEFKRPELNVFDAQSKSLDAQNKLLTSNVLPKFGFFLQGGYGRPALNMLSNEFQGYYIGGFRLSWTPSSFYTLKKKRVELGISRQEIDVQKQTFIFNSNLTIKQQNNEISKYQQLLTTDEAIIKLREQVKTAAMAQLENGVITSNDFLKDVNDEDSARQNKVQHELQLLMAQYNQQFNTGN